MANLSCVVEKQTPNYNVLCSTRKVTMTQIPQVTGDVLPKLWEYAFNNEKICMAGPSIFFYEGECVDELSEVELTIAIPIVSSDDCGELPDGMEVRQYPSVKVVSFEHPGGMPTIGESYGKLAEEAAKAGFKIISGQCREIYTHWIGFDSPENRTELQFLIEA